MLLALGWQLVAGCPKNGQWYLTDKSLTVSSGLKKAKETIVCHPLDSDFSQSLVDSVVFSLNKLGPDHDTKLCPFSIQKIRKIRDNGKGKTEVEVE